MKKILVLLIFSFLAVGLSASANEERGNVKFSNIKIYKKQLITDQERKSLDEIAKGKSGGAGKSKSSPIFATGVLGERIPTTGTRYAIVIGLANYSGTVNDLCAAAAKTDAADSSIFSAADAKYYCQDYDSIHMKDVLTGQYGYDEANIILLRDGQATKAGIFDALNNLKAKVDGDDEVTFFYSGHGVSGNYPGDSESVDEAIYTYDNNFVWDDDLKLWAQSLNVYREVFIFDMCLAGGMKDIAGTNRVVAMSSGENQSSYTYSLGGAVSTSGYVFSEGLFSHSFVVNGMTNLLADSSNLKGVVDGKVAIEEAFSYTYPIIKIKQAPVLNDGFLNDLLLGY